MDEREIASDCGGELRLDMSGEKLAFHSGKSLGRQIVHSEEACLPVFGQDLRDRAREPACDRAQPCGLRGIARDRRLPQRYDLQPRQ